MCGLDLKCVNIFSGLSCCQSNPVLSNGQDANDNGDDPIFRDYCKKKDQFASFSALFDPLAALAWLIFRISYPFVILP